MTSHTITGIFPAGYNVTVATLFNQGTISGPLPGNGIGLYSANSADIINSGTIAPGSLHPAVSLHAGGTLTNQAGGTIGGSNGVSISGGAGTVVNAGSIAGTSYGISAGTGIYLQSGGSVANVASASITGHGAGIKITGGVGTVLNEGSISAAATFASGVYLSAGTVVNDGSIAVTGRYARGVFFPFGGSVTNAASASIISSWDGVRAYGWDSPVNVVNYGSIAAGIAGVKMAFGSLTNGTSASISGVQYGVNISADAAVVNEGTIAATGTTGRGQIGIHLYAEGSVTNAASAIISGHAFGVVMDANYWFPTATLINEGSILGGSIGVALGGNKTLTNGGTIIGNGGTAVSFSGTGPGLLVLEPGYGFSGIVTGSASASDTLELASAAGAGVLTGLGTEFVNFGSIVLDAGATWTIGGTVTTGQTVRFAGTSDLLTLSNPDAMSGTIDGFEDGDTIALAGIANVTSTTMDANNLLTVTRSVGALVTLQFDPSQDFSGENFHYAVSGSMTDITIVTRTEHWVGGSGNFNTAAHWNPQYIPDATNDVIIDAPGTYTVTASTNETMNTLAMAANAKLVVSAGTFTVSNGSGPGGLAGTIVDAGAALALAGSAVNTGTIAGGGQLGAGALAFTNGGTVNANASVALTIALGGQAGQNLAGGLIEATRAGGLTIASGTIGNAGTMLAANGGKLTYQPGVVNTNNSGGVLSWGTFSWKNGLVVGGGAWEASGKGSVLSVTGGAVTMDRAAIILSGPGSIFRAGDGGSFTNLEASLGAVAPIGVLELLAGRSFIGTHGIADYGMIQLAGGTLKLPRLAVGAGGNVRGFGTIADTRLPIFNGGTIEAQGGTLAVATPIDAASSGVFQLDASSVLEIAADQGAGGRMSFLGTGGELIIDAAAKFGLNVGGSAYTGPLVQNFGTGDAILLKNVAPAGLTPVYDTPTGILQLSNGSANVASLMFDNTTLGTGSFHLGDDGLGHALLTHS